MKRSSYVYCIFRLDRKLYPRINRELLSRGYKDIKAIVPTVSILKRSRKGKSEYEDVPILFNYGFIRMRSIKAFDRYFLNKLRKNIPGILSFVKSLEYKPRRKRLRVDNAEDFDDYSFVATIERKEFRRFMRMSKSNKIYSARELTSQSIGDFVILRGYPFEGIPAVILDINLNRNKVLVKIYPDSSSGLDIEIPMDNVLYSAYKDGSEDKLYSTAQEYDLSRIADDGTIENILSSKQY